MKVPTLRRINGGGLLNPDDIVCVFPLDGSGGGDISCPGYVPGGTTEGTVSGPCFPGGLNG